jgi:uncharacterized protein (DUF1499 family)
MAQSGRKGRALGIGVGAAAVVATALAVYFAVLSALAKRPENLGVQPDGKLLACPNKPNCVSTFAADPEHAMAPIRFEGDPQAAWKRLRAAVAESPRTVVVADDGRYMHVEFRSLIFRFPDDVEFLLDPEKRLIHFRSASRAGYSDLGVNRARMQKIAERMAER